MLRRIKAKFKELLSILARTHPAYYRGLVRPKENTSTMEELVDELSGLMSEAYNQGVHQHGLEIGYSTIEDILIKHGVELE